MSGGEQYTHRVVDQELDELMPELAAIAIEGARGVGKTETASRRARSIHRFDDPNQRAVAEADLDAVLATERPLLIDEWQYVPAIWDRVRRAVDASAGGGSFLLTGSSSPRGTGTHSGAGRIVSLRMRPWSLAERIVDLAPTVSLAALLAGTKPPIQGDTQWRLGDYTAEIMRSGFPGIRPLEGRARRAALESYIARIVDRDFPELGHVLRNPDGLRRWMSAYAAATATTASFEKIRDASTAGQREKPAKTTVVPYRDVLERLFVLDALPGWKPTRGHIAELGLPPKHHLADPALAVTLLGASQESLLAGESPGPEIPRDGTLLGALFESLLTVSIRVYAQAAEARVGHLRTHRGQHEIDLIVERGDGRVVAIEVKLAQVPREDDLRHLKWLERQIGDDLLDAVVVTTGTGAYRRKDGIAVLPAALLGP